jgi:cytochrome b subunit of formate dehydrogenase
VAVLLKLLYWVAVVAISVALVIGLILWLESRDASDIERSAGPGAFTSLPAPAAARA